MAYTALRSLPVHERLFHSTIGITKAEKHALEASVTPATSPSSSSGELAAAIKGATVTKVKSNGLVIVRYPPGKKEQKKENELTSRGRCRNALGGFYSS